MRRFCCVLLLLLTLALPAYAGLELSTDHRWLFFGVMQLGDEKALADFGTYHNQITCSSNSGNPWYLKINLLGPLSLGQESIPLENFKWQLAWTNGAGSTTAGYQFRAFTLFPDLVYTSAASEAAGGGITFQFKYFLKIPQTQLSGTYNTTLRFTLTEIL